MQNKKLIVLIVLSVGAVFSLFYGLTSSPRVRYRPASELQAGGQGKSLRSAVRIFPKQQAAKRTHFTSWGRNPFVLQEGSFEGLVLNGLLWDEVSPIAIINDTTVGVGDKIDGKTIVDIEPDKVILNDGIKDIELKFSYGEE